MRSVRVGATLAWLLGWLILFGSNPASAQATSGTVLVGHIQGTIDPPMAGYVEGVIGQAEREGDQAVVFYMDTPGGLSDSMREINSRILSSTVPVVVYVAPGGARAASAGMYIAYAAQLVGMAPTSNIGSATPVQEGTDGSQQQMTPEMQAKVTNDAVAQVRALAQQRQRNGDFAEEAIRQGSNLPASAAYDQHVVNYLAADLPNLLQQMDGAQVQTATGSVTLHTANVPTRQADPSPLQAFLLTISDPTIAYLLLSAGSLALMVELYNPGAVFPGVIGGVCILLAFYALGTLPLNYAAAGFAAFGLVLFGLEPFLPTHGILAVGGITAFALGSLLLVDAPDSAAYLRIQPGVVAGVSFGMLAFIAFLVRSVFRVRHRQPLNGAEGMLGEVGVARAAMAPGEMGRVTLRGESWQAVCPTGPIAAGDAVVVDEVNGLMLAVHLLRTARIAPLPAPGSTVHGRIGL